MSCPSATNRRMVVWLVLVLQIGIFLGAWLGGLVFQGAGCCDRVWHLDIVLAAGAALIHLPIRESLLPRPARAPL